MKSKRWGCWWPCRSWPQLPQRRRGFGLAATNHCMCLPSNLYPTIFYNKTLIICCVSAWIKYYFVSDTKTFCCVECQREISVEFMIRKWKQPEAEARHRQLCEQYGRQQKSWISIKVKMWENCSLCSYFTKLTQMICFSKKYKVY